MLVRFTSNIGSNDAAPLGLDFSKCLKGMMLNVTDTVGVALLKKCLAVKAEQPAAIKAVPVAPAIAGQETKSEFKKQPHTKGA